MPKTIRSPQHDILRAILIEARHKAGLTQAALGDRLGRPQSFIAKYENGERRLDVIEFVAVIEGMGAEPKKLFAKFMGKAGAA